MVAVALLFLSVPHPLPAAPGETMVDPYVALTPTSQIDPAERLVARKGIVFEQPLAWPAAAVMKDDVLIEDKRYRYRIKAGSALQSRPFAGNFGNGRTGNAAFCGRNEYQALKWDAERWKPDPSSICLFDSDGDGTVDEWRPMDGNVRFTTKTDPFAPVAFTVTKNHQLEYPLQLIYSGNIVSNVARAFTVKLGGYTPLIVPFEKIRQEGEWTILGFQGAELAVANGPKGSVRARVLKPFDEGAPFAVVTSTTFR